MVGFMGCGLAVFAGRLFQPWYTLEDSLCARSPLEVVMRNASTISNPITGIVDTDRQGGALVHACATRLLGRITHRAQAMRIRECMPCIRSAYSRFVVAQRAPQMKPSAFLTTLNREPIHGSCNASLAS